MSSPFLVLLVLPAAAPVLVVPALLPLPCVLVTPAAAHRDH